MSIALSDTMSMATINAILTALTEEITELRFDGINIDDIESLEHLIHVTSLYVEGCECINASGVKQKSSKLPRLPPNLKILNCDFNNLTELPPLPEGLTELYCRENDIKQLIRLPKTLKILKCTGNVNLHYISKLPPALEVLDIADCCNLGSLPDLPETLIELYILDGFDKEIYPHMRKYRNTQSQVTYINECNSRRRIQERTRTLNRANVLLELYEKRMMHPARIAALLNDENANVDEIMQKHIETL